MTEKSRDEELVRRWESEMMGPIVDFALRVQKEGETGENVDEILNKFWALLAPKITENCVEWCRGNEKRAKTRVEIWANLAYVIGAYPNHSCAILVILLFGRKAVWPIPEVDDDLITQVNKTLDKGLKNCSRKEEIGALFDAKVQDIGPIKDKETIKDFCVVTLDTAIRLVTDIREDGYVNLDGLNEIAESIKDCNKGD